MERIDLHVRSGEVVHSLEAETCVFDKYRAIDLQIAVLALCCGAQEYTTYRFCCPSALVRCDFLNRALYLYQIHILVPELNDTLKNGLYL